MILNFRFGYKYGGMPIYKIYVDQRATSHQVKATILRIWGHLLYLNNVMNSAVLMNVIKQVVRVSCSTGNQ